MRSQVRFFMHPDDELEFLNFILDEPGIVLVDMGNWPSPEPPVYGSSSLPAWSFSLWNPSLAPELGAELIDSRHGPYWSCDNPWLTVSIRRSILWEEGILTEGGIGVVTSEPWRGNEASALDRERRYKRLRKWIQTRYSNRLVRWFNPFFPTNENGNPSDIDRTMWVSPSVPAWCAACSEHKLKQARTDRGIALIDPGSSGANRDHP